MNDTEIRLIEALGMNNAPAVATTAPSPVVSPRVDVLDGTDLQSALSELAAVLGGGGGGGGGDGDDDDDGPGRDGGESGGSTGQQQQEDQSQRDGGSGGGGAGGGGAGKIPGMNAAEFQFQFDEDTENRDEILERFRDEIGEARFRLLLQNGCEGELASGGSSHAQGAQSFQGAVQSSPQPTSRTHPAAPFDTMSGFSESSPAHRVNHQATRECSQSSSPSSSDSNRDIDMLEMAGRPIAGLGHWMGGRVHSHSRSRNYRVGSAARRQAELLDDPIRAAERERVRGENRARKKRWRESNQDRNRDNDLRCRVTKRAAKIHGPQDSPEKAAWVRAEFDRRRAKREAKERARISSDRSMSGLGVGSSSVFPGCYSGQHYLTGPSAAAGVPGLQQPYLVNSVTEEAVMMLQNLIYALTANGGGPTSQIRELLGEPELEVHNNPIAFDEHTPQVHSHEGADPPQVVPGHGRADQNTSERGVRQATAETGASRLTVDPNIPLDWEVPRPQDLIPGCATDHVCPKFREIMAALQQTIRDTHTPEEIARLQWPVPPKLMRVEAPVEANTGRSGSLAATGGPGVEAAVSTGGDSGVASAATGLTLTDQDGDINMNDEELERLIAETGIPVSELLYDSALGSVSKGTSIAHTEASSTQRSLGDHPGARALQCSHVHGDIGPLDVTMSLEQIDGLLGDLGAEGFGSGFTSPQMPTDRPQNSRSHQGVLNRPLGYHSDLPGLARAPSSRASETSSGRAVRTSSVSSSAPARHRRTPPPPNANSGSSSSAASFHNQSHANFQSPERPINHHYSSPRVDPSYIASFGNTDHMNKRLMKPLPYRPGGSTPVVVGTTGAPKIGKPKSIADEKKIKAMGFPPLLPGMKQK